MRTPRTIIPMPIPPTILDVVMSSVPMISLALFRDPVTALMFVFGALGCVLDDLGLGEVVVSSVKNEHNGWLGSVVSKVNP